MSDVNDLCSEYLKIKNEISKLEEKSKKIREQLLLTANNNSGKLSTEYYKISASVVSKETFDLKTAKAKLDEDILNPFINRTTYEMLNVKRKND